MLKRLAAAAILIPAVLWVIFRGPLWLFVAVELVFALAAAWELSRIVPRYRSRLHPLCFLWVALLPPVWAFLPQFKITVLLLAWLSLAAWTLIRTRDLVWGFPSAAVGFTAVMYLGMPFSLMTEFHRESPGGGGHGPFELFFVLVSVWIVDSCAFFAGRALGRHHVTPSLSSGKTLEGFLAGLLGGVGAGLLFGWLYFPQWQLWYAATSGLVIAAAAIGGDLFESLIKRGADVKDTSGLIPGHGGVLDRIDSLLFAFPAYYLLASLLG